jgi:hypothetical protein
MEGESLQSSILSGAFIACNKCSRVEAEEGYQDDVPGAAEIFYQDGWRVINDLALCSSCAEKEKK